MGHTSSCGIRGQFGQHQHAFALTRLAAGKIAGQRCGERLGAVKGSADKSRLLRLLASPVPCRAADTCRKPRLLCGPSRHDAVRPAPPFRAQAVFLAALRVRHFFQGQKVPPYSSYAPKGGGRTSSTPQRAPRRSPKKESAFQKKVSFLKPVQRPFDFLGMKVAGGCSEAPRRSNFGVCGHVERDIHGDNRIDRE
jgi:hypothetical protein